MRDGRDRKLWQRRKQRYRADWRGRDGRNANIRQRSDKRSDHDDTGLVFDRREPRYDLRKRGNECVGDHYASRVINNATTVNVVATNPGGTFVQDGGSDVVMATNPPGIQNVPVVSGTVATQNVVTAINQTTAPFLTGANLNTTAGNAITGVTTTSTNAPFVNAVPVQTGNFLMSVATATTPVVNAVAAANSGASASASSLGCGVNAQANGTNAVALGTNASAGASNNATAVGTNANTTGDLATALGANSIGIGLGATALGANAVASANGAIAIGASQSTGVNSIAIGTGAVATGSIAVGFNASTANGGAAFGDNTVATGINSVALGMGASAPHANAAAIGSGATTSRNNQVVIGTATNTYTTPGVTSNASITAQSGPLSIVTTDANGNLAHVLITNLLPAVTTPCQELVAGALQCGTNAQASATQSTALGQTSAASGVGSTAVGFGSVASGAGSTAQGQFSVASGSQSSAFGAGANASGAGAVAVGVSSSASAANSVALGNGSVANAPNTVSVGSVGNERRVTNVAPGVNPTDAVNVSQLQGFGAGFQSQIGGLQQQIFANNIEARRGIAAAAALSPAIMPTAPGRTTVSVNGGFFHGETGVGVGVSHRLNLSMPLMIYGSYANGGGDGHVGRIGGAFEF
jgi:autotransporter adhesin